MMYEIKEFKQLKGEVMLVLSEEGKPVIKWTDNTKGMFCNRTLQEDAEKGIAYEYGNELIDSFKRLFIIMANEELRAKMHSLKGRKVNEKVNFNFK